MACMIIFCDMTVKTGDRGRILILGPLCRSLDVIRLCRYFSYFRFEEDYVICSDVRRAFFVFFGLLLSNDFCGQSSCD